MEKIDSKNGKRRAEQVKIIEIGGKEIEMGKKGKKEERKGERRIGEQGKNGEN